MKKLLIVVDMLNDFCDEAGALAKSIITGAFYGKSVIVSLGKRIAAYRTANDPIIWLRDWHKKGDLEFERFPDHAVENTWGAQIIDSYNPQLILRSPYEIEIPKTRYSGFYGTDLEYRLARLKPDQVEIGGVCTSICVMDTIGGLANRDYSTAVYKNCVADFDPVAHEFALGRMARLYGTQVI